MEQPPRSFPLRRLVAVLTTPFVVGLVLTLLLAEDRSVSNIWGAIGLCYLLWLFAGVPGLFFRQQPPKPAWVYPAVGAGIAVLFTFPFGAPGLAWPLTMAAAGAAAGGWYWFCAYWQPNRFRQN
jgi:hypothetical protein